MKQCENYAEHMLWTIPYAIAPNFFTPRLVPHSSLNINALLASCRCFRLPKLISYRAESQHPTLPIRIMHKDFSPLVPITAHAKKERLIPNNDKKEKHFYEFY